ncbi:MAG: radical SAM protein, partial [Candidatus Nanoarchaeia archaeon]
MKNPKMSADCIYEKKKWISITGLCNNNCLFCLDGGRPDRYHKKTEDVKNEILEGYKEGATKLILSGGDPTIHPDLIKFVEYGRELGYKKIQVITNGRMFASKDFTNRIISAGLDEVTFSLHGHNRMLHDTLTRVPGSFRQVVKGVNNVKEHNIIINTDTCVTKLNYRGLANTMRFIVEKLGIREVNLMVMLPQGNAWKHKNKVICKYEDIAPYINKVVNYCRNKNIVLWLSRMPAEYLEGNEDFIDDPYKLVDEVNGRQDMLCYAKPACKGERCYYCPINKICDDLIRLNYEDSSPGKIEFDKVLYPDEVKNATFQDSKKYLITIRPEHNRLDRYEQYIQKASEFLSYIPDKKNIFVEGLPKCMLINAGLKFPEPYERAVDYAQFKEEGKKDFIGLAKKLSREVKVKRLSCKKCLYKNFCTGTYLNYIRLYGFGELEPVISEEIRINLECNQDCVFCNTDKNAQNLILNEDELYEKLKNLKERGVNYLIISGKEPTLSSSLTNYINYAKQLGYKKVELQTNAITFSSSKNLKIAQDITDVFISLHAHNDELSTKITKTPGSFFRTIEGIKNLQKQNVKISINLVINSENYKELLQITKFIHKLNPDMLVFSFVAETYKTKDNPYIIPRLTDTIPYIKDALKYCEKKKINYRISGRCGVPICMLEEFKEQHDEYKGPNTGLNTNDKLKPNQCKKCTYYDSCSGLWQQYVSLYGSDEIIPIEKKMLDINVGKVCNNNCKFCMSTLKGTNPKFADTEEIINDIYCAKDYKRITFLGGEPTIHPDILRFIKIASKNKIEEIHLVSNGRRFSDIDFLKKLLSAGLNFISVSFHSHKKEVENYLCDREEAFNEKLQGLKNIMSFGELIRSLTINIVVTKKNMDVPSTIEFFKKHGVQNFRINSMMSHEANA